MLNRPGLPMGDLDPISEAETADAIKTGILYNELRFDFANEQGGGDDSHPPSSGDKAMINMPQNPDWFMDVVLNRLWCEATPPQREAVECRKKEARGEIMDGEPSQSLLPTILRYVSQLLCCNSWYSFPSTL